MIIPTPHHTFALMALSFPSMQCNKIMELDTHSAMHPQTCLAASESRPSAAPQRENVAMLF
jgi:hypothetical protein